jgi:hypothetical protein
MSTKRQEKVNCFGNIEVAQIGILTNPFLTAAFI